MSWNSLAFNENAFTQDGKVRCPNSSPYKNYAFRHPAKLIKPAFSGTFRVVYHDDWVFKLLHRTKPIVELRADAFREAFYNETLEMLSRHNKKAPYLHIETPQIITAEEAIVLDDLRNT